MAKKLDGMPLFTVMLHVPTIVYGNWGAVLVVPEILVALALEEPEMREEEEDDVVLDGITPVKLPDGLP
jgi:ABC-type phosphate transport system permease subunit